MAARLPRPPRFDLWAALAGLVGGLLLWGSGLGLRESGDPQVVFDGGGPLLVPLVLMSGCELLRRTAPRTALLTGTLALAADLTTQGSIATIVMYTDLMYAAVLYGPPTTARRLPWITGMLSIAATLVPFAVLRVPEALLIGVVTGAVTFTPASTGLIVRNHRETADAALLRAEQTALLAEMDRTQAVTAERARMARELHDMVANHLSAIAIHSTAALSLDDPATTRQALGVIRENSVAGLAEMRRLIGILRDDGGDTEPAAAPTLDGLGALVDGARSNGLDVTLDALDADPGQNLPAPVELAAYRIVQESLTNALKHAAPGPVRVRLDRHGGALRVRVTSPYGDRDTPRAPGSGAGLVGMRERAALLHGTFEAGAVADPGAAGDKIWAVRATLPLTEGDLA
ncbi:MULTISPECIES: histidine kinase [Streptomyces]|uniref:sensor histidine kinase n=1 Tax=Streptomyces TaxID=1883 RepID=UPI001292B6BE|nr:MULTISPECIES: histidine kinase [Streptomyces]KAF2777509.1 chitinase two-component sensor kinase [Streptomyces sp. OM5714]MCX5035292.1 histidine kinase [Streptomyces coelicoflavus]MDI6518292.1 histidine kinase [Streptomyces coelicoflavus]QFX81619.1 two-component sensor histidine kinase [Streptomyces sp. SYP-A7193]